MPDFGDDVGDAVVRGTGRIASELLREYERGHLRESTDDDGRKVVEYDFQDEAARDSVLDILREQNIEAVAIPDTTTLRFYSEDLVKVAAALETYTHNLEAAKEAAAQANKEAARTEDFIRPVKWQPDAEGEHAVTLAAVNELQDAIVEDRPEFVDVRAKINENLRVHAKIDASDEPVKAAESKIDSPRGSDIKSPRLADKRAEATAAERALEKQPTGRAKDKTIDRAAPSK